LEKVQKNLFRGGKEEVTVGSFGAFKDDLHQRGRKRPIVSTPVTVVNDLIWDSVINKASFRQSNKCQCKRFSLMTQK
jgi:hypothetical protein